MSMLTILLAFAALTARPQDADSVVEWGEAVPRQPYARFFTRDRWNRRIACYLSEGASPEAPLPLVVYIQGSGGRSHFGRDGDRIRGRTGHNTLADVCRGHAVLLLVEKPGVAYLDQPVPSSTVAGTTAFHREHTLGRWAEAVSAALRAARTIPGVDPSRTLVVGHSEGGLVACRVAATNDIVTHVASLAGGGPTQLFDLVALAHAGHFFRRISEDPDDRVEHVLDAWDDILEDPDSAEQTFFGHPYRRWSSFLASSPIEELMRTKARVFIAQATEDTAVTTTSFDVLHAQLLSKGREVTAVRVPDADHSFAPTDPERNHDGWKAVLQEALQWFLR